MNFRPLVDLFCVICVIFVGRCDGFNVFEFVFGPKLGQGRAKAKSIDITDAQYLVEAQGYAFEAHEVTSNTGHILSLHRIPYGKEKSHKSFQRPVALFQHGLLAASDSWLFRGSEKDLPYIMAQAGYDVWLSNMRGNVYSSKHKTLDPENDAKYWKFGLEEVALYDLPVIIDYILHIAKQKSLYFLGHSIGSSVGLILCSLRPEYNSKIKAHIALAPLVYVNHPVNFLHKLMANPMKYLTTTFPDVLTYYPSGTSVYLFIHTLQMYFSGQFSALDYYNSTMNHAQYNNSMPPSYNLTLVTSPVLLLYGNGDYLVTESDINYLESQLPNAIGKFAVAYKNFNHMDFMWGLDSKNLLYERILMLMKEHR